MTPKQQRFVDEYLIDLNAAAAYRRAGYAGNDNVCAVEGHRLLSNPNIAAAVSERRSAIATTVEVTQERIVAEFARMAFYDPASIAGRPMIGPADIPNLPEDVRRSIVGWGWDKAGNFTLKLADKNAALTNLGRHLGMFTDKVDVNGSMSITVSSEDAGL